MTYACFAFVLGAVLTHLGHTVRNKRMEKLMMSLDSLIAQVQANTTVVKSAKALIEGLATRLSQANGDPTAIATVIAELRAADDELAAAVVANTPADESPVPDEKTAPVATP